MSYTLILTQMENNINKYCIIDFKGEGTFECFKETSNDLYFIRLLKRNKYAIPTDQNIKTLTRLQIIDLVSINKATLKVGCKKIL